MVHIIVGGNGQVGSYLQDIYKNRKEPYISINKKNIICYSNNSFLVSKNTSGELKRILKSKQIQSLIYLASKHTNSEKRTSEYEQMHENSIWEANYLYYKNILDTIRSLKKFVKVVYASSSLIYEGQKSGLQNEETLFAPKSIYAKSKVEAMNLSVKEEYQESLDIVNAICFNHESSRRKQGFLSQKLVNFTYNYNIQDKSHLEIHNVNQKIDWSHAFDLARALDFLSTNSFKGNIIVSSGKPHTPNDFLKASFKFLGLECEPIVDKDKCQANDVSNIGFIGDNRKLCKLGFKQKFDFSDMVNEMMSGKMEIQN